MYNVQNITRLREFLSKNYRGTGSLLTSHSIQLHGHLNDGRIYDEVDLSWFVTNQQIVNAKASNLYLAARLLFAKLDAVGYNTNPIDDIHNEL